MQDLKSLDKGGRPHDLQPGDKRGVAAWCLFDFGNSAFSTVIITFVYSVFFAREIVGDETTGSALWSYALAASGLLVAVLGPFAGGVADHYGVRKRWLGVFSALCIVMTVGLVFVSPSLPPLWAIGGALSLVLLANVGFEMSLIFANAMLPSLVPQEWLGRVSGWAWGLGYAGGLLCLAVALVFLIGVGGQPPLLSVPEGAGMNIRLAAVLVAVWYGVFMLPLLFFSRDMPKAGTSLKQAVGEAFLSLYLMVRDLRGHKNLLKFLVASALYRDGLNTLFAVGGLFAAGVYGLDYTELLIFAIGINVTAGIGAAGFAFLDDRLGSRKTVLYALCGLIVSGAAVLLTSDQHIFLMLALLLGVFIGPAQAASRTLAARLAPADAVGQVYGLYALSGKSVAFLGPLFYGLATSAFDSQRAGMAIILLLWIIGFMLLKQVEE